MTTQPPSELQDTITVVSIACIGECNLEKALVEFPKPQAMVRVGTAEKIPQQCPQVEKEKKKKKEEERKKEEEEEGNHKKSDSYVTGAEPGARHGWNR